MGLMDRFRGAGSALPPRARVEPTLAASAVSPSSGVQHPEQWLTNSYGSRSAAGQVVTEATAMTLPAVMQALRILCGVFAITPLVYYRQDGSGKTRAVDSPLFRLFHDQPNKINSPFAFKELLLADVILAGNYYSWVSGRDPLQRPHCLTRLEPGLVNPVKSWDREQGYEKFFDASLPDHSHGRFSSREIWHVPGFTRDGLVGQPALRYMREAIGGALGKQDFANRFFANDAKPSVVLTTSQKVAKPDKDMIKADWNDRFGGSSRAHGVAVVDQDLKPLFLSTDNEKSQLIESRTFDILDVARCFGVPPHLLFELSKATFSNIEHQSLEFVIYHMMPHYERVSGAANMAFAEPGCFFEFMPDALLKGDTEKRWAAYKSARETGVLNADEIRSRENLNAIGGEAGTTYLWPANMMPAGERPAPVTPTPKETP
jgi:HK97 family phage portal protein